MATFIENLRASMPSIQKNSQTSIKGLAQSPFSFFKIAQAPEEKAERATMYLDERLPQFLNDDIYRGYTALNKILEDYDRAETYEDRDMVIKSGFANYQNKNRNIAKWFDLLKNLNDYANAHNDPAQNVSKTMRHINDFTRKNLYPIL